MLPNVKLMDSQREPKACDAILQAVVQRSQLIPEVLDLINETWTKIRGEEFVSSLSNDKDVRVEQDEANWIRPTWCGWIDVQNWTRIGCCQNYSQNYWPCS